MEILLFFVAVLARALDPIGFIIVLVALFKIPNKKHAFLLGAGLSTIVTETILTFTNEAQSWGDSIFLNLGAGCVQACLALGIYFLTKKFKESRKAV